MDLTWISGVGSLGRYQGRLQLVFLSCFFCIFTPDLSYPRLPQCRRNLFRLVSLRDAICLTAIGHATKSHGSSAQLGHPEEDTHQRALRRHYDASEQRWYILNAIKGTPKVSLSL